MAENRQEDLLIVGTMSNFFDKVNITMLWELSAEVFCRAEQDNFPDLLCNMLYIYIYIRMVYNGMCSRYLVQNVVCLLEIPS